MTIIRMKCDGRMIRVIEKQIVATGDENEDVIVFEFSDDWDGYQKTAVFRAGDESYHQLLDINNSAVIPHEVLQESRTIKIGIFGVNDTSVKNSMLLHYNIVEGAKSAKYSLSEPTLDVYAQILRNIGDLSGLITSDKTSIVNAINEVKANETNVDSDDALELLYESGIVCPVADENGAVLTDSDGNILTY